MEQKHNQQPSAAFIGTSWAALLIGVTAYLIGLWTAEMELNEKGYYFTLLMSGLFSAISVQKAVRDQMKAYPARICITALHGLQLFYQLYYLGLVYGRQTF